MWGRSPHRIVTHPPTPNSQASKPQHPQGPNRAANTEGAQKVQGQRLKMRRPEINRLVKQLLFAHATLGPWGARTSRGWTQLCMIWAA